MKRKKFTPVIMVFVLLIGLSLLLYPTIADKWNAYHQSRAIIRHAENMAKFSEEEVETFRSAADDFNRSLVGNVGRWSFSQAERETYESLLITDDTNVMAYIEIPKIKVSLPVYHGTGNDVLQGAIGHLEGSSLPVGGKGTHCVLSGHRGLPSARLFTDLDKLREGDTFTMTILNETLTYEVDHIWIVEPSDLSHLTIEDGKDYCTLITCTPYGINTHRLLVRAHRIENANGNAMVVADAIQIRPVYIAPFLAIPILLLLLIYVLISTSARYRKKKRDLKEEYLNENGLHEEELEIEDQDIVIEAVKSFMEKRRK